MNIPYTYTFCFYFLFKLNTINILFCTISFRNNCQSVINQNHILGVFNFLQSKYIMQYTVQRKELKIIKIAY